MIFFTIIIALFSFVSTWFVQGINHPIHTPSHLILIVGLAFLMGQNNHLIRNLIVLSASLIAGFLLNYFVSLAWNIELIMLAIALIVGLLVVLKLELIQAVMFIIVAVSGLLLGFDSSPVVIPGLSSNSIYNWLFGAAVTIVVMSTLLAALATLLNRYWNGIILRVIGSWIATSAIFTLTLQFAKV